jgi:hypothetical protein
VCGRAHVSGELQQTEFLFQTGTIAGNLAMKHEHNKFPSDIYLILETVGATLNIGELSCVGLQSE